MKNKILIILAVFHFANAFAQTDSLRQIHSLTSHVFGNTRNIRVLLPPRYYLDQQDYPVLYMNDGNSVFKNWGLQKTVYNLIDSGLIAPIIVVGVDNAMTPENMNSDLRTAEYLPYPDALETTVPEPKGKLFPQFITQEVVPFIESKYRAEKKRESRAIGGSSYGGYAAFYTYLNCQQTFGKALIESTPFFISDCQIIQDVLSKQDIQGKLIIGLGTKETPDETILLKGKEAQEKLVNILREHKNLKVGLNIREGATHNSKAWADRLADDLKFLFGK